MHENIKLEYIDTQSIAEADNSMNHINGNKDDLNQTGGEVEMVKDLSEAQKTGCYCKPGR